VDDPSAHRHRRPAASGDGDSPETDQTVEAPAEGGPGGPVDLSGISVAGITRRRVGWASAALVAIWIVVVFARQVGDAQAATGHAEQLARDNAELATEVEALQKELDLIVQPDYVAVEARGERFGSPKEIPFTLDPSVPAPVDGAPGSASVRLGSTTDHRTPLESWLSLLFGPAD
jgi:cell division protein FtsB